MAGSAFARFDEWVAEGRAGRRRAVLLVLFVVVTLTTMVVLALTGVTDGIGRVGRYGGFGSGLVATVATYRRMTRRVRTGEQRREIGNDAPITTVPASLWWAVGRDRPVVAWVALHADDTTLALPVLNVDPELDLPHDGRVEVTGTIARGEVVRITFADPQDGEDRQLDPAGPLRPSPHPRPAWVPAPAHGAIGWPVKD